MAVCRVLTTRMDASGLLTQSHQVIDVISQLWIMTQFPDPPLWRFGENSTFLRFLRSVRIRTRRERPTLDWSLS